MALKKVGNFGFKCWQIEDFTDYVEYLVKHCGEEYLIFRGQPEDEDLLPKIARIKHKTNIIASEKVMFNTFKRTAVRFLQNVPDNLWDWLAIAQHHGLPTRLLDWTKNPLAALWFTVRRPARNKSRPGIVWVFRPISKDIISDVSAGEDPFKGKRTKVFEPKHVIDRIRTQDGAFTVHKFINIQKGFIPLQKNMQQKQRLEKIFIPTKEFSELRFQLDRCGIQEASLFPDLDGLSRHIEWSHSLLKDEE
jgi:FRG domain